MALPTIRYKITARTPVDIAHISPNADPTIPAAAIRGAARFAYEQASEYSDSALDLLFGTVERRAELFFTDAVCTTAIPKIAIPFVSIDRSTGLTAERELYQEHFFAPGSEFTGSVAFGPHPNGQERSFALSALVSIYTLGRRVRSGFGQVDVQILERTKPIVFVSYSWEDEEHTGWVIRLARQLIEGGFDVILDRFSPGFTEAASQEETRAWMRRAFLMSDKIVAVLSPEYKLRSDREDRGVGYEVALASSEVTRLSGAIRRHVCLLRRGNRHISVPVALRNCPIIDVTRDNTETADLGEFWPMLLN